VEQLEANLVALGHDPGADVTVDGDWDYATTAAVTRWEDDRDLPEDAVVARGEVVFLPGPRIVGDHAVEVGSPAAPGAEVFSTSSRRRVVTLDVGVGDADLFRRKNRVAVELPNGDEVRGRVSRVAKVATPDASDPGAEPTVEVVVRLPGSVSTGGIDQAPVDVIVEASRAEDVLAVPVSALLATTDGLALEVLDGPRTRTVSVEAGAYAEGWVEVSGPGVEAGTKVVVAP
jgi:hypothetical protein